MVERSAWHSACHHLPGARPAFDRGLREGMLVQMMRQDGVWGDARATVP